MYFVLAGLITWYEFLCFLLRIIIGLQSTVRTYVKSSLISHTASEPMHFLPNYVTSRPSKMIQLPDFSKLQVPSGKRIIFQLLSCDTIIINYYVPSTVSVTAFYYVYHTHRYRNRAVVCLQSIKYLETNLCNINVHFNRIYIYMCVAKKAL